MQKIDAAPMPFKTFPISEGRGAEGIAIGALLESAASVGGVYGGGQAVHAAWLWLQQRFDGKVMLSHGALKALIRYDIMRSDDALADSDLVLLDFDEAVSRPPSELNHTGHDMMLANYCTRRHERSWVYLVTAYGKVLHANEGGPIPSMNLVGYDGLDLGWELDDPELPGLGG